MNLFKRLRLAFSHGPELEQLVTQLREENEAQTREANRHRLNLCFKHRQEANHSHFAEHNCHHCQLLERLNEKETAS